MYEPRMKFQIVKTFKPYTIVDMCDANFSKHLDYALHVVREDNREGIFIPSLELFYLEG